MIIHCCECNRIVEPRLTDGAEVYPHREDLSELPFWICDECGNFVGCHHKTDNPTQPLGSIPSRLIKMCRKELHSIIDPMWKNGWISRRNLYKEISRRVGWEYHTGNVNSEDEADQVKTVAFSISFKLRELLTERQKQHIDGQSVKPISLSELRGHERK